MRAGSRLAAAALGLLQATTAGCAAVQTPTPALAAGPQRPPQNQCEAVRDVDFRALERAQRPRPEAQTITGPDMLEVVRIPDWAARRPPPDAPVVIRARMPPGGGYNSDHRSVVALTLAPSSVNRGPRHAARPLAHQSRDAR